MAGETEKFGFYDGIGSWNESWSGSSTVPNNALTYKWMQEANAFNAEQAELNRQFQERMSNTAYQRAMKDMKLAGLNPILAGNLGGASTPSGSAAQANFTGAGASSSSFSHSVGHSQDALGALVNFVDKIATKWVKDKTGDTPTGVANKIMDQGINAFIDGCERFYRWHTNTARNVKDTVYKQARDLERFINHLMKQGKKIQETDYDITLPW